MMVAMGLAGCGPDETAQEQRDAGQAFERAQAKVLRVAQGYAGEAADKSLDQYKLEQYRKVESELHGLVNRGTPVQKAATAMALAEVRATQARHHARAALDGTIAPNDGRADYDQVGWANIATMSDQTMSTLLAARQAHNQSQAIRDVDTGPALAHAQQELSALEARRNELNSALAELQQQADQLSARHEQLAASRTGKLNEAEELRRRSLSSAGQARYDLYTQASQLTREADQLGAQVENLNADLGKVRSRMQTLQGQRDKIARQIADAQSLITDIQGRRRDRMAEADRAAQEADRLASELVDQLKQAHSAYTQRVMQQHDQAIGRLGAAVSVLDESLAQAPGSLRDRLRLERAMKQAELAHVARQAATTDAGHADFLSAADTQVQRGFPQAQANQVRAIADAARARSDESRALATAALTKAAEQLADVENIGRNDQVTAGVLRQVVAVNEALADQTGEAPYRQQAQQAQGKLDQLNPE